MMRCHYPPLCCDGGPSWIVISGHRQKGVDGCSECAEEFIAAERPHDCRVEPTQQFRRQVVEPSAFGREAPKAACERQSLVPQATDPVLRLPRPAALDRDSNAHGVVRGEAEQVDCSRSRWSLTLRRASKQELELRSKCPESRTRGE